MRTIKEASIYLLKLVEHQKSRLEYGLQDRERIKLQLELGQNPSGYRVTFIMKSAGKLIEVLGEMAQDFDNLFPNDKASLDDLLDVIATSRRKLEKYAKQKEEDGEDFT